MSRRSLYSWKKGEGKSVGQLDVGASGVSGWRAKYCAVIFGDHADSR